jgi:hypothetical protein
MSPSESPQDKRLAENEVFFREHNQRVQKEFEDHKDFAVSEQTAPMLPGNATYDFYCECADEKCTRRIPLTLEKYAEIHKASDHFVIAPDHEVDHIEDVIVKTDNYMEVRKHTQPPASADSLNPTTLDHN